MNGDFISVHFLSYYVFFIIQSMNPQEFSTIYMENFENIGKSNQAQEVQILPKESLHCPNITQPPRDRDCGDVN